MSADPNLSAHNVAWKGNARDAPITPGGSPNPLADDPDDGFETAEPPPLAPNRSDIEIFLRDYVGTIIHVVSIKPDAAEDDPDKTHGRYFGDAVADAARWLAAENAGGRNCYWTVNVTTVGLNKKPAKKDIAAARFSHADIDPPKGSAGMDKNAALAGLLALDLVPSFVIDSGNGLQPLWRLAYAPKDWLPIEDINRAIAKKLGADNCQNIDRLLRVPGTINWPDATKRARGRVPVLTRLAYDGGREAIYTPDQMARAFPPIAGPKESNASSEDIGEIELLTPDDLGLSSLSPIRSVIEHPTGEDRSKDGIRAAGDLLRAGFTKLQVLGILLNPKNKVSAHYIDQADPRRAALRTIQWIEDHKDDGAKGQDNDSGSAGADGERARSNTANPAGLPTIQIEDGELSSLATQGEKILIAAGVQIYQRGGKLVRPIIEIVDATRGRQTRVVQLKILDDVYLRDLLCRHARWEKYNVRTKKPVPVNPPSEVAQTILARTGDWRFPAIAGVISAPTMRPDGSLLTEPGYDETTRLLLVEPPAMPEIPNKPTRDDALQALALLEALLTGFSFSDETAKSCALSAMITPVVRGAFPVTPMHASRAPAAASGKSFLWDVCAAIAIGQPMPVISTGGSPEETEKRLGSAFLAGQPLISIDNINGELGGDALCQLIERPTVDVRVLGRSESVRIEARGTSLFATGNNFVIVGDVCRRTVTTNLDPGVERPELRQFDFDPVDRVLADRGKYIVAALTICRAYCVAGRSKRAPKLASFEGWSDTVRSALIWLGKKDPVDSMEAARAEDPERTELRDMLEAWSAAIGTGKNTRNKLADVLLKGLSTSREHQGSGLGANLP